MPVTPRNALCLFALAVLAACGGDADPAADPHAGSHQAGAEWVADVAHPEFPAGAGPAVFVDAAHGNFHTIDGRFAAFAGLLRQDGYRVYGAAERVSDTLLAGADVFVIANAVLGGEDADWRLPTPPAFTADEVDALLRWVAAGGSLLLIADHMPFPGSVADLADAFGIVFYNGYAKPAHDGSGFLVYTREHGLLRDHAITRGRQPDEFVASVKAFTGQGFGFVVPGAPLLVLPDDWSVFLPQEGGTEFDATTPFVPARGLLQGGVLRHGDGRVAVFGEAAMFSAQTITREDGSVVLFGMNDPEAAGNARFVLNVMHWLSGRLDAG